MPSAKMDVVLGGVAEGRTSTKNYCCRVLVFSEGLALGKEPLPRAVLCRVSEHFPSANPRTLGKDALSGNER